MAETCELCTPDMVLIEDELAYVRYDNNSLSKGHVLAVPRRHVADFFDMTTEEKAAILSLLDRAKAYIAREHSRRTATISASISARPAASRGCTCMCILSRATPATWQTRAAASAACWRKPEP